MNTIKIDCEYFPETEDSFASYVFKLPGGRSVGLLIIVIAPDAYELIHSYWPTLDTCKTQTLGNFALLRSAVERVEEIVKNPEQLAA